MYNNWLKNFYKITETSGRVVYNIHYNLETRTTHCPYYEGCIIILMPDKSYGDNNDTFPYYNNIIYNNVSIYV